jgi:methylase of polypeptide subunit release factors
VAEVIFNGIALSTAPGVVMTPRAASERLVAESSKRIGWRTARVADVGTGTGAIAISERCINALVWATESDHRAVALASANVERHGLADRVFVRFGDLLAPVPAPVDLIVANLSYVAAATADEHVGLHEEPFAAVFAPGDGLGPSAPDRRCGRLAGRRRNVAVPARAARRRRQSRRTHDARRCVLGRR